MGMGIRTPGPVHMFSRFRGNTQVYYMGTAIAGPEPEEEHHRLPVMNDLGGRSVPLQIVKDGIDAVIFGTLNRFDYLLLQTIRGLDSSNVAPVNPLQGNLLAGSEIGFTRGSLVMGITDFQLILFNEYAGTVAAGNVVDQPSTRIYFSVEMLKMKESTAGTRVLDVACAFKATSIFNYQTFSFSGGNALSGGGLYSEDPVRVGVTTQQLLALIAAAGA